MSTSTTRPHILINKRYTQRLSQFHNESSLIMLARANQLWYKCTTSGCDWLDCSAIIITHRRERELPKCSLLRARICKSIATISANAIEVLLLISLIPVKECPCECK
ncbi:hypothetical protein Leryth_020025 [Lithospermum erythrorhizon]|nr:hypothetical protein Leryth_020025 [Lithospermum erythrorhizon]